jgi:hypothetical protein
VELAPLETDVVRREDLERLIPTVLRVVFEPIEDQDGNRSSGMVSEERSGENASVREVVPSDDRADEHLAATILAKPLVVSSNQDTRYEPRYHAAVMRPSAVGGRGMWEVM